MKYGRSEEGNRWHMLPRGQPICFSQMKIVEVRDRAEVKDEDICENCDAAFREKGKLLRQSQKKRKRTTKTDYNPRFKFKE